MGASDYDSRDMVSIMENYASLNGVTGMNNPDVQVEDMEPLSMPPHLTAASRNHAVASASSKTMGYNKFLGKPKRPLSAYNIFQHEREKIVSNAPDTPVTLESLKIDPKRKVKKRRHRKSHGKIGFADLARTIAEKWKTLDAESRAVFEACAAKEKERYADEIKNWKAFKKAEVAAEEEAAKKQAALSRAEMMYNASLLRDDMSNRDLQNMRSLVSAGWSSRTMTDGGLGSVHSLQGQSSSMEGIQDPRDYLKITQQVIDMARASLSLPLFANLGRTSLMDDSTRSLLGEQSSLRMNSNPSSNFFHPSNNMESSQLSNGALLNVPFGNNMAASLDNDSHLFQNQLMQSIDSNIQGYLNQASQLRDEFETRAFLNQPMQYHQAELDSNHQEYSEMSQISQDRYTNTNGGKSQSHQGDGDDLINMINASLKDRF